MSFSPGPRYLDLHIPPNSQAILSSTVWRQYECGRFSEDECYRLVAEKFSLDPGEVRQAILDARNSLQPDDEFLRFVHELQEEEQGTLRIFAMSNISAPDYAVARNKPAKWEIFERVFTSADVGMRKPDLRFFKYVLDEIKAEPSSVVFVDDRSENVLAARSLGINGIIFDNANRVRQALRCLVCNPVSRGHAFLEVRAGRLESETDLGQQVPENFAQLLILEATSNRKLVNYVHHPHTWNFFKGNPIFTTNTFPADMDTTSIGLTVTHPDDDHVVHSVMDEMLQYTTEDGITTTYFDSERQRIDPVVALNVLTLFYSRGRGEELAKTLEWVLGILEHRAYLDGTRYYETAECFLFFASRLLSNTEDAFLHSRLAPLLRERILERAGVPGDALALSMRVLAGAVVGLRMERDLAALLPLQREDGGWEPSWIYKYGSSGVKIGNRGLTTALALKAIAVLDETRLQPGSRIPFDFPTPQSQAQSEPRPRIGTLTPNLRVSRGISSMPLPSPPPSPTLPSPKRVMRERGFSASSIAKGVYAYLFPDYGASERAHGSRIFRNSSLSAHTSTCNA
ncbi:hypothetical protein BGW80DRAFT_1252735 [Lactifluus volemus]|nr:hypothetical protein BGW80DRAFT_1252735 [Lactifluus volemus]